MIVDNCSTDRTSEIADRYAQLEGRIRVHRNQRLVSVAENHQIGFRQMAAQSEYCKVVHADDWIFPDCLRQMVAAAEAHPEVGIVSAHALEGEWVGLGGLPYPTTVFSGRETCRLTLLRWAYVFGSPSALLIRSDCIRARETFYDEEHFPRHFDTASCYQVLQHWDFGFVHQVLTYSRQHPEAQSALSVRLNSYIAEELSMLTKYGPLCVDRTECEQTLRQWRKSYRRFLALSVLRRRDHAFWQYHRTILRNLGWSSNAIVLVGAVLADLIDSAVSCLRGIATKGKARS